MADISKIKALDGVTYNLKDATARKSNMSQTEATTGTSTTARYISAKVLNDTIAGKAAQVVELTQAEYDALANPDPKVLYLITDADDYGADKVDITLYAANWVDGVYTISDNHISDDTVQLAIPQEGITDTQLEALQGANIQAYGQDAGHLYLKAYGDVPSIDVPISVVFHPGVQAREVESQKQDIYSTNETVVGTWIDGKPIYRKYFTFSNTVINSSYKQLSVFPLTSFYAIRAIGIDTTIGAYVPLSVQNRSTNTSVSFASGIEVGCSALILEYTKPTD